LYLKTELFGWIFWGCQLVLLNI